ncbi:hypothetical protein JI721_03065 [Alicyclobacillus cycloheptanicus]|uniref:Uncharacterized protein n=1 Tax=Alicyclobacillus cycloheptanicus TaxID=1457 RepID=A0ABT9XK10_9BACL|nr:hypothetical protein [Alicyclobacillus cycloheptanicus]MDQ0190644.1 hypothetical protein [Alicyclobacillus cycloheptanicus]WDM01842.1 hypothetical protein JI721_03065 [Alicyclobacillus cycloheptanicus]
MDSMETMVAVIAATLAARDAGIDRAAIETMQNMMNHYLTLPRSTLWQDMAEYESHLWEAKDHDQS